MDSISLYIGLKQTFIGGIGLRRHESVQEETAKYEVECRHMGAVPSRPADERSTDEPQGSPPPPPVGEDGGWIAPARHTGSTVVAGVWKDLIWWDWAVGI